MDEFEQWWAHYPKKQAKGDARKAWKQTAALRPPLERLIKAVIVAKGCDQWRRDGGQYIPLPATWLRGERWDDVHEIDLGLVKGGKAWHETSSGIEARAKELGMEVWTGYHEGRQETFQQYRKRVMEASESTKVVPIKRAEAA